MNPNGLVVITPVQHIELGLYILRALRHNLMILCIVDKITKLYWPCVNQQTSDHQ